MNKDQFIGTLIFLVCVVVSIGYIATLFYPRWLTSLWPMLTEFSVQFWLIAIPVVLAFIAILGIGAWIGWTMATTPPPKPIEEIETEEKTEEEEEKQPQTTSTRLHSAP